MDLDKILRTTGDYGAEYVRAFVSVLVSPGIYFGHSSSSSTWNPDLVVISDRGLRRPMVNSHLLVFATISITLGIALWSLAPASEKEQSLTAQIVIPLVFWTAAAGVGHWICRLCGSETGFEDTLAATVQVAGVSYVLGSLSSVVMGATAQHLNARALYPLVETGFMLVLWPRALRAVHQLRGMRQLPLFGVPLIFLLVGLIFQLQPTPPMAAPREKDQLAAILGPFIEDLCNNQRAVGSWSGPEDMWTDLKVFERKTDEVLIRLPRNSDVRSWLEHARALSSSLREKSARTPERWEGTYDSAAQSFRSTFLAVAEQHQLAYCDNPFPFFGKPTTAAVEDRTR